VTSRERVLTSFSHTEPDRVPVWCGASPEFIAKAKRQLGIADTEPLFVRFGDDSADYPLEALVVQIGVGKTGRT